MSDFTFLADADILKLAQQVKVRQRCVLLVVNKMYSDLDLYYVLILLA